MTDRCALKARATFAESDTATRPLRHELRSSVGKPHSLQPDDGQPGDPTLNYRDPAVVQAVRDNPAAYANPSFIPTGQAGAQHPVPAQLAILLNSRTPSTFCTDRQPPAPRPRSPPAVRRPPCGTWGSNTTATENPALYRRPVRRAGPQARWQPQLESRTDSLPPRSTANTNEVWQVDVGLDFDIGQEWTGEFFLSHGESATYNVAGGNLSLRALPAAAATARLWPRCADLR